MREHGMGQVWQGACVWQGAASRPQQRLRGHQCRTCPKASGQSRYYLASISSPAKGCMCMAGCRVKCVHHHPSLKVRHAMEHHYKSALPRSNPSHGFHVPPCVPMPPHAHLSLKGPLLHPDHFAASNCLLLFSLLPFPTLLPTC